MKNINYSFLSSARCKRFCSLFICATIVQGVWQTAVAANTPPLFDTEISAPVPIKVTGRVVDELGEPLPGVTIVVKGTPRGVTTDIDGSFSIDVTLGTELEISYIGMEKQIIKVKDSRLKTIVMKTQADELEEVTVVAFAKQKKESVIASVSTVKPTELKVPSSNLTTAFAGRIAGMISYQRSGEPGEDNADFFIRGVTSFGTGKKDPLILIDGVEMTKDDLARLTTDDIASFSIMKDANATALYGARGANGVILVATKEGEEGKVKVDFRAEGTLSMPTEEVELADPVTYMRLHNEAVRTRNPLTALPYSTTKIVNTEKGLDPIRYPAIDWRDMLFKKNTFNQRYNLNISGGGKVARYYVSAAYNKDTGIIKMDKRNNFNNNIDINKIVLRANVNVNLTKTTEMVVRLHGAFDDYSGPLDGGSELYKKALHTTPVLFQPYYTADEAHQYTKHILFGNAGEGKYQNPYADMVKGYQEYSRSTMLAQFEAKQKLDFITKGLAIRGLFNINRYSKLGNKNSYKPFYYEYVADPNFPELYQLTALNPDSGTEYLAFSKGAREVKSTLYFETALSYNRSFKKHDVSGLLVYTMRDYTNSGAEELQLALPARNLGLAGRFTYGFDKRYFVEANFGYNGSERFAKKERFGFFPSAGIGWIVTNESFMKPTEHWLSKLKLKATYGLVGNDQIGDDDDRFFYLSQVNPNNSGKSFTFGEEFGYSCNGVSISRYADPYITWEIARKLNVGLELNLWDELEFQIDYFQEKRSNILQKRSDIPTSMGLQAIPSANVGKAKGGGVDFSVDYNHSFNKNFWISARGNFTYASSKFSVYEEPDYSDTPWLSHVNQKIKQTWGLIAERLFVDEEEVRNSPKQTWGVYGAGDIKYKDINGDNIIDDRDKVPIGYPTTPEINYGFGISAGLFRDFDFSCFFQGSARSSFWIDAKNTSPFVGSNAPRGLLKYYADDHWSEDSRNIYALWPRLSESVNENNTQTSTWFMRNGAFLRLKTLEVGYTIPQHVTKRIHFNKIRFYVSGTNLFVWSKFKMWDPELAGNCFKYPLQRVFNFGINVNI